MNGKMKLMKRGSKEWINFIGQELIRESKDLIKEDQPEGERTLEFSATLAYQLGQELIKISEVISDGEEEW